VARQAVRDGADLLGPAGGDGTQAVVAGVAVESGLPFMVVAAGTRNHFAMDLGLDLDRSVELAGRAHRRRGAAVDLGRIGDRTFVNNASFAAYAGGTESGVPRRQGPDRARPASRAADRTSGPRPGVRVGDEAIAGPQAVLVSNNPYATHDMAGLGRRDRLDAGVLGVLAVTVKGAADAARLLRGRRSRVVLQVVAGRSVRGRGRAVDPGRYRW
jgi:hypothetical protein